MAKAKKEVVKKERKAVAPTEANLKTVRQECAVVDYSLRLIREKLSCTWKEAVFIRKELLKLDKKS